MQQEKISQKTPVLVIAEAGVNHNGSIDIGKKLIERAAESGADVVKFQTFKTEIGIAKNTTKAKYQRALTDSKQTQFQMVKDLELDFDAFRQFQNHCHSVDIEFTSTAFDIPSLNFLVDELSIPFIKIPSGDILNAPLLLEAALKKKKIILSSGMSNLGDIEIALGILAFGFCAGAKEKPNNDAFMSAYNSFDGQTALRRWVSLLHCTSEYPAPFSDLNLLNISTYQSAFQLPVGLSDHSQGISAPIAATALGASIIEKHFTLDKNQPGPDHIASLEPSELTQMIKCIREVEVALGSTKKIITPSEYDNLKVARKVLVAAKKIKKGHEFEINDFACKRKGPGIAPNMLWDLIGSIAKRDYELDDVIE